MARRHGPLPKWNDGMFVGPKAHTNPTGSWWVGLTREQLRSAIQMQHSRMTVSRYGTLQSPVYGPNDPKAGWLRARTQNAPGVREPD